MLRTAISLTVLAVAAATAVAAMPPTASAIVTQVQNATVGDQPEAVAAKGAGRLVFIGNRVTNTITVLNVVTRAPVASFPRPVNGVPVALAVDRSRNRLYDLDLRDRLLVRNMNTGAIIRTVALPLTTQGPRSEVSLTPQDVAVNPSSNRIYVSVAAAGAAGRVLVINGETFQILMQIPVGLDPSGMAVAPGLSQVLVANSGSDTVSVIHTATNSVTRTFDVGDDPQTVAFLPGTRATLHRLVVPNRGSGSVSVARIGANGWFETGRIAVGSQPIDAAADAEGETLDRVYVTNRSSSTVTTLRRAATGIGLGVLETVAVAGPLGVAVEPLSHRVVVSTPSLDRVSVLARFEPLLHGFAFVNRFNATLPPLPPLTTTPLVTNQVYGLCGGMAFGALDTFNTGRTRPAIAATPSSGPVHDALLARLVDTFSPANIATWLDLDARPTADTTVLGVTIPGTASLMRAQLDAMRTQLNTGRPVPLGIVLVGPTAVPTDAFGNHQVLAIGRFMAGTEEVIEIYDPNFPDTTSLLFTRQRILRGVGTDGEFDDSPFRGLFVVGGYQTKTPIAW